MEMLELHTSINPCMLLGMLWPVAVSLHCVDWAKGNWKPELESDCCSDNIGKTKADILQQTAS